MNPLLMLIYNNDELLTDVCSEIARLGIEPYVRLVGAVPYDRLPSYYTAADYFILGSHHEGSGFALLEALACGVPPIVTDIPSFRAITSNGTVGALWKPGDPDSFVQAFHKAKQNHSSRQSLRAYFERELSYDVLGKKALRLYEEIVRRKNGGGR
jgi:glycosyltransferase involved in cell wall biosynthesis